MALRKPNSRTSKEKAILAIKSLFTPIEKHSCSNNNDWITVQFNQIQQTYLYKSPENLIQDEGWFPYYFDEVVGKEDVLAWLRKLNFPDNLFQIETRIVYPRFKRSYPKSQYWNFNGFSKICLEKARPSEKPLLTTVKSSAELLFNKYIKNKPHANIEGFFITTDPMIASTDIPKAITVLSAPSMIRNKQGEPLYLRNIINMAKLLYPNIKQTGYCKLEDMSVQKIVKIYHNDQIKLPHLIVMEQSGEGARACTWGTTDINELLVTAKQIIQQGYVSDPENPLAEQKNGNPFIAIKYHEWTFFLDKEGNTRAFSGWRLERIQEAVSKGFMSENHNLYDEIIWNRIQLCFESTKNLSIPENYEFKWVEITDQDEFNGRYWLLQAHHTGGETDMAVIKRFYTGEDFKPHSLSLYFLGPAFIASGNSPDECDLLEYSNTTYPMKDSKTKSVEQFKTTVEEKVVELLNSLKEKAQEAA